MAGKLESTWTGLLKDLSKKYPKVALEDKALVKALIACDKIGEAEPAPRVAALDEVIEQIKKHVVLLSKRTKELGNDAFKAAKDKLYALLQEAEGLHKSAVAKAAEAKADQAKGKSKDDEEEEESPALLSSKMIPLLRELKKGEVNMPCLIALTSKEAVVLVSRRAISPARVKLLKEQMAQPSGLKSIRGECLYEKNALTFVVQSPGAALAKRLRQALLDQTAMRWKVRVRGEDGVVEEDGAEEDETRKPATPEQLAYTQRLLKVRDRYQKALREQHPKAVQYKELMDQASAKANEQQDYDGASQVLQVLDKAMDEPERTPGGGVDPGEAFKARLTAMLPRLKEAQAAGGDMAQDVKLKVSEAGVFARKKSFDDAHRVLDELEELLGARGGSGGGGSSEAVSDWDKRFGEVESRYQAVLKTQPATASDLRTAMAAVNDAVDKGDLARAETVLMRLTKLLDDAGSLGKETDVIPEGIVAAMKEALAEASSRWDTGVNEARVAMKPLKDVMKGKLAAGAPMVDNVLLGYRMDLSGLLQEAQTVQDEKAMRTRIRDLNAKLESLRADLRNDRLLAYLDECGQSFRPALDAALVDIEVLLKS